jgi:hypothetical protein
LHNFRCSPRTICAGENGKYPGIGSINGCSNANIKRANNSLDRNFVRKSEISQENTKFWSQNRTVHPSMCRNQWRTISLRQKNCMRCGQMSPLLILTTPIRDCFWNCRLKQGWSPRLSPKNHFFFFDSLWRWSVKLVRAWNRTNHVHDGFCTSTYHGRDAQRTYFKLRTLDFLVCLKDCTPLPSARATMTLWVPRRANSFERRNKQRRHPRWISSRCHCPAIQDPNCRTNGDKRIRASMTSRTWTSLSRTCRGADFSHDWISIPNSFSSNVFFAGIEFVFLIIYIQH